MIIVATTSGNAGGDRPCEGTRLSLVRFAVRALVSVHFVYELVDKFVRFDHWKSVILAQAGLGTWSLVLVVALLVTGTPLLLAGVKTHWAAVILAIFQLPTTILFEDDSYGRADSISALGGVFAVALWDYLDHQHQYQKEYRRDPEEPLLLPE